VGIRTDTSRAVPLHDVYSYLVYAATGSDVAFTMVDGEVAVSEGAIQTVDAESVYRRAREQFEGRTWGE